MVQVNVVGKEINVKIVFYGPALSGKTTNLEMLHKLMNVGNRAELMSLKTKDDRTLFFDVLPAQFKTSSGYKLQLKVFTVPGQVIHNSTRRVVLQGADGVAFIADSQNDQTQNNKESFKNLEENLQQNNIDPYDFPVVMQFNKRDLPNIKSPEEIKRQWEGGNTPVYLASAFSGEGVVETFVRLVEETFKNLETKHQLSKKFGFDSKEVVGTILKSFGKDGDTAPRGLV